MKSNQSISSTKVLFWVLVVNIPLILITIYVHYLLKNVGGYGNTFMNHSGVWLLVAFKIIGANLILATIFSEFKIK